jgi:nucleoside-diphosphate-sugar epimerase
VSILITGGCGYVGTKLTEAVLSRTRRDVTVLDTQWFGNHLEPQSRLKMLRMDVREIDSIDLSGYDTVFHLANIANDPSVEINPYASWEINVLATMRLIDRAARHGVKQFVFASSASVYGLKTEPNVTEDLELVPLSEYNKTKMVAERVIMSYAPSLLTTIVRPATVCGPSPRMRLDLTVNLLTMQALTDGAMTVFGGSQVRPNIHIDDLVDAYLYLFEHRIGGVYNAGFENLTVLDIANRVAERVPAEVKVLPSNDPRSYRVCSDRLVAAGFAPRKSVATAIEEIVVAHRDGWLKEGPVTHNVTWMKQHNLG